MIVCNSILWLLKY